MLQNEIVIIRCYKEEYALNQLINLSAVADITSGEWRLSLNKYSHNINESNIL